MSGKSEGKKRNRAAQSGQHGFQEPQDNSAARPGVGEAGGASIEKNQEKQRVLDKLRRLQDRLKEQKKEE